jgi:hypothetical protein
MVTTENLSPAKAPARTASERQCPYCGAWIFRTLTQCSRCREALPEIAKPLVARDAPAAKRGQIRRGLLYMLLASVVHYFAGGYSAMHLPFPFNPALTVYLSPLLFFGGLGLTVYGLFLRATT